MEPPDTAKFYWTYFYDAIACGESGDKAETIAKEKVQRVLKEYKARQFQKRARARKTV